MTRISNYFNGLADKIAALSLVAGTASHKPDIGANRENIIRDFLNCHLPRRLSASLGGQVITPDGIESGQIDVIISNDIGIRFEENEKTFVTAECVAGAITVKTTLDSHSINDAMQNLATIPEPNPAIFDFKLLKSGSSGAFLERHPSYFIFAYDGIRGETCIELVKKFYQNNQHIPSRRFPCSIILNKKYIISYLKSDTRVQSGHIVPKNTFYLQTLDEANRGYPFVNMLNHLLSYADWLNYMSITFHNYFNEGFNLQNP